MIDCKEMPVFGRARGRGSIVALVLVLGAGAALASPDQLNIERFEPAMDNAGIIGVDWADVPGHMSWSAGLWASFAHDPLVLYDASSQPVGAVVRERMTTGFVGTLALWGRLQLGVGLDAVGYQASGDVTSFMDTVSSSGVSDVRFAPKLRLYGGGLSRVHVALIATATLPTGSAGGYLRDTGPSVAPELAVGAITDRLRIGVNAGVLLRKKTQIDNLVVGDEVFARGGVALPIGGSLYDPPAELDLAAMLSTSTSSFATPAQTAAEVMLGASVRLPGGVRFFVAGGLGLDNGFGTPDWRAIGGVRVQDVRGDRDGDGIEDVKDRCPDVPEDKDGFQDQDGCPDLDDDNDGIPDSRDKCRLEPEDKDGFQDQDGCPDPDNDKDGIPDASDKCPNEPEDKDGYQDADGCPDPSGEIDGKLVDAADQHPVTGATIEVTQVDHPEVPTAQVTGADDGSFVAKVHGGTVKVKVTAPGYQLLETTLQVPPGKPVPLSAPLARVVHQGQVSGQVLSFNGKPLAATVTIAGKTVKADADGFYKVDLPEGTYDITIESPGHATQKKTVSVKVDRVTVLNIDMRKGK